MCRRWRQRSESWICNSRQWRDKNNPTLIIHRSSTQSKLCATSKRSQRPHGSSSANCEHKNYCPWLYVIGIQKASKIRLINSIGSWYVMRGMSRCAVQVITDLPYCSASTRSHETGSSPARSASRPSAISNKCPNMLVLLYWL